MLAKFLVTCGAVALLVVLALPFGREIYYRYEVWHNLDGATDQAAFAAWPGSARSFERQLANRCKVVYGSGAAACDRYQPNSY
jgi:hypothetical protein